MNRVSCVWMSCDEQGELLVSWACTVGRILGPCISPLLHRYSYPLQGCNVPRNCDDTCLHRAAACTGDRSWGCLLVPAVESPSNKCTCRNKVCNAWPRGLPPPIESLLSPLKNYLSVCNATYAPPLLCQATISLNILCFY